MAKKAKKKTQKEIISDLELDVKDQKDKNLRLLAEFENFKKRTTKERIDLFKSAGEEICISLLPILDDFERAMSHDKNEGLTLIFNKINSTLKQQGLKIIEVKKGDKFNTDFHEAITKIPAEKDNLKNKIVDIIEKGYTLNEKVIRFAKVIIGN